MAASNVTRIRTVFLHVLHAILAYFGFATPQAPAAGPRAAAGPAAPAARRAARIPSQGWSASVPPAAPPVPAPGRLIAPRSPLPRELALPPTIKQRIRAEAHGSSPSVRRVPCGTDGDEVAAVVTRDRFSTALGAPRGADGAADS